MSRHDRIRLVDKDPLGGTLHVVVLAGAERPDERDHRDKTEHDRERREEEKDVHRAARSLSAFRVTTRDDPDIARAATKGFTRPIMAAGAATRL